MLKPTPEKVTIICILSENYVTRFSGKWCNTTNIKISRLNPDNYQIPGHSTLPSPL